MIGHAINKLCSLIPLSEVESYQTELCVVEACNNVIEHAYRYQPHHELEVVVSLYLDRITFEICDRGRPLDGQPPVALEYDPNDLANLPEGGMGLFLMNSIMDKIDYRSEDGRNVLTLEKRFSALPTRARRD